MRREVIYLFKPGMEPEFYQTYTVRIDPTCLDHKEYPTCERCEEKYIPKIGCPYCTRGHIQTHTYTRLTTKKHEKEATK